MVSVPCPWWLIAHCRAAGWDSKGIKHIQMLRYFPFLDEVMENVAHPSTNAV